MEVYVSDYILAGSSDSLESPHRELVRHTANKQAGTQPPLMQFWLFVRNIKWLKLVSFVYQFQYIYVSIYIYIF